VTVALDRADLVATAVIDALVRDGALARDGDRLRDPSRAAGLPSTVREAMDRLEAALASPSPPSLADAARAAGCPPDGVRALEAERRIVRLEDDLAWSAATYKALARTAVTMAAAGPLTPAAFRDATGSSRKYVMAILEDLDRRELLRRTDVGHVLGRRSLAKARPATPAVP
jgi:selenocysteine-specific elongation factor